MQNLAAHARKSGNDLDMQQAVQAVFRYFDIAAVQRHAVEEQGLLPMSHCMVEDEDANLLKSPLLKIVSKRQHIDAAWIALDRQLQKIASGESSELSETDMSLL